MKIGTAAHAVNHIISSVNPLHGCCKSRRLQNVTLDNLYLFQPGTALQASGISHKTPHPIASIQQSGHQPPSNIAGGAGD
jgi:hypothetical protein